MGAVVVLALALGAVLRPVAAAPAADEAPVLLGVNVARGHIDLAMIAPVNSTVTFFEDVEGAPVELGTGSARPPAAGGPQGMASIPAIPWRCDRTVRRLRAQAKTTDGRTIEATNEARTPECRDRIRITAPTRVEPGARIPITLKDRWQLGDLPVRVCVARAKARRQCSSLRFAPGQKALSLSRNAGAGVGIVDIDLVVAGTHRHQKVGVGRDVPAGSRPVMLVTGDSMIQGIDTILGQQLKKRFRVIGQTRPGTGVSKPLDTPWTTFARQQATNHKPAVTVVLLGGNDGFPMTNPAGEKVECCGEAWRVEYLSRLETMADAYGRGGRGTIVWSLLPPTRRTDLVEPMGAVNDAIRRLAAARPQIELVDLHKLFGPTYRDDIGGQRVRDPDGLHFSLAGQRMAAKAIIAAIRKAAPAGGS
ncbi:MAG TPA: GDSL-type esterase/lipase family protein [Baekduia sp.]|nr:GDSL-type esterase/lipase family protein [Baekduia sp.]